MHANNWLALGFSFTSTALGKFFLHFLAKFLRHVGDCYFSLQFSSRIRCRDYLDIISNLSTTVRTFASFSADTPAALTRWTAHYCVQILASQREVWSVIVAFRTTWTHCRCCWCFCIDTLCSRCHSIRSLSC